MRVVKSPGTWVEVEMDFHKIKKECPKEAKRLELFIQMHDLSWFTFVNTILQENTRKRENWCNLYHKEVEFFNEILPQGKQLYQNLQKAFKNKTSLDIYLISINDIGFWTSKLKLEKKLYKYSKALRVGRYLV